MMMQAEEWNELYPVGTRVRYYPVADEPGYVDTHTRSVAWTLGSGHVVVEVDGQTGGVSVEHLVVAGQDDKKVWIRDFNLLNEVHRHEVALEWEKRAKRLGLSASRKEQTLAEHTWEMRRVVFEQAGKRTPPQRTSHILYPAGPIVIGYLFGNKRPLDGMSDELLVEVAAWCIEESVRRDASYAALPQSTVDWANAILERRRAEQPRSCSPQTSTERVKAEAAARGPLPASIIGCWPGDETDEELLQGLDELRR